ncbi:protein LURP-one-related 15-like [Durio zibethinus]|uniref:Protein LURP-one-related 15-like n=1 Tax=Durio zibethinus TaxID=66656 RepID=A0A6P6A8Z7_DURZI|nr:protein LURP-one-related 15-like [Durio zibethinus]
MDLAKSGVLNEEMRRKSQVLWSKRAYKKYCRKLKSDNNSDKDKEKKNDDRNDADKVVTITDDFLILYDDNIVNLTYHETSWNSDQKPKKTKENFKFSLKFWIINSMAAIGGNLPVPAPANAYTPVANPIVVIGEQFLATYPVELKIQQKVFTLAENNFNITDVNGNPIFKVKGKLFSLRDRRVLLDAAGNPLVSLKQKILTVHRRWQVFKGESNSSDDLLFSVKKSSMLQFKTTLDVFLASNTSESQPDFRIKGGWHESSCTIYAGDTIIAEMHRKHNVKTMVFDTDTYGVTAYPNVDYAFIVALVVVLDEINADRSGED